MNFSESTLKKLYDQAVYYPEHATKKMWLYLLYRYVCLERSLVVGTEQPPEPYDSLKRVDIIIEQDTGSRLEGVVIWEKRRGKAEPKDTDKVETQVFQRCSEFLNYHTDRSAVWAMTAYGPCFRLWAVIRGSSSLHPVFPLYTKSKTERTTSTCQSTPTASCTPCGFSPHPNVPQDFAEPQAAEQATYDPQAAEQQAAEPGVDPTQVDETSIYVTVEKIRNDYVKCKRLDGTPEKLNVRWTRGWVMYGEVRFYRQRQYAVLDMATRGMMWQCQRRYLQRNPTSASSTVNQNSRFPIISWLFQLISSVVLSIKSTVLLGAKEILTQCCLVALALAQKPMA